MKEKILNIYLVIENGIVVNLKAENYLHDGSDNEKIDYLKSKVESDFENAEEFGAPVNKNGEFMPYKKFHKLEKRGLHFQLFEGIFSEYEMGDSPLVCVTPVVDGEIKT